MLPKLKPFNEAKLWTRIREHSRLQWTRVENAASSGMFDCFVAGMSGTKIITPSWVELKVVDNKKPYTPDKVHDTLLRKSQKIFLINYQEYVPMYCIVYYKEIKLLQLVYFGRDGCMDERTYCLKGMTWAGILLHIEQCVFTIPK